MTSVPMGALLVLVAVCGGAGQVIGPPSQSQGNGHHNNVMGPPGQAAGIPNSSSATSTVPDVVDETCDACQWESPVGAFYDLSSLCGKQFEARLQKPRGAKIMFGVCTEVECDGTQGTMGCIHVPSIRAVSTGREMSFEAIEPHIPSKGIRLILHNGEMCTINNRPRRTIIDLECYPGLDRSTDSSPTGAWEGEGSDLCSYYVTFPTPHACPVKKNRYSKLTPLITAVTGCVDSIPKRSTGECHAGGGTEVIIHGLDFQSPSQTLLTPEVTINKHDCTEAKILNEWMVSCKLPAGTGEGHGVSVLFSLSKVTKRSVSSTPEQVTERLFVASSQATVSYKPLLDYKQHFDSFMDLGVGGLTKQIRELYQRAFGSRGIPAKVLDELGIEHAKGILLYGPPGSGKTLLARTMAKILKTDQVKMINAPEIMSKYLGESEKNLRGYFAEAEKAWMELGESSDLYIIIIDEIDAICKPRGKSDTSAAAAAYDSVVNQLLTKMDGLKSLHNLLVVGMTNRPELIDAALLRPGRFEIQIEIGLPDEVGRWEIFYIHTREMRNNGYMSQDVNLEELAKNTTQFSGAEIAGIVRLAASYALNRKYGNASSTEDSLSISRQDFVKALEEFKPAYTQRESDVLDEFLPQGFLPCGKPHNDIVFQLSSIASLLQYSSHGGIETVLLYGPKGVGKSGLAAHIASLVKFTFVKVVSATKLLNLGEFAKIDKVIETFQDAYKASFGLIILDDLHRLVELVNIGSKIEASRDILHTLATLLNSQPPPGCKLLVIGTLLSPTENLEGSISGKVGLQDNFENHFYVPTLQTASTFVLLDHMDYKLSGGHPVMLSPTTDIPLKVMLKVTDCVDHELDKEGRDRSQCTQMFFWDCLKAYNYLKT